MREKCGNTVIMGMCDCMGKYGVEGGFLGGGGGGGGQPFGIKWGLCSMIISCFNIYSLIYLLFRKTRTCLSWFELTERERTGGRLVKG